MTSDIDLEKAKKADKAAIEWFKQTDFDALNISDFDCIMDNQNRFYNGLNLEQHLNNFCLKHNMNNDLHETLKANLICHKGPAKLDCRAKREKNHAFIEKMRIYGEIIEKVRYKNSKLEVDYVLGIVLNCANKSLGDDFNLPTGYVMCLKFERN